MEDRSLTMLSRRSLLATVICLPVAACQRTAGYRFRLTVDYAAGGRQMSVSGVRTCSETAVEHAWTAEGGTFINVTGDALVLDVPGGAPLFVTLVQSVAAEAPGLVRQWVPTARLLQARHASHPAGWGEAPQASHINGSEPEVALTPAELPLILSFADPADPATMAVVDPANAWPARILGGRVRVTQGLNTESPIEERLPWLPALRRRQGSSIMSYPQRLTLHHSYLRNRNLLGF